MSVEGILNDGKLTPMERERIRMLDPKALSSALAAGAVLIREADFPEQLAQWESCPPGLFAWGCWDALSSPCIGIVGTRGASTYGKAAAYKFAEAFARAGVTVVSGGALGIDAAAHKGALEAGGRTVAVLATGVDRVYPAVHRGLFKQIRERGCLVSQYACGMMPSPYKFLVRNQLVAALSHALLVVEAPERSGSLSTAHAANDLNRSVFVVPANIDNTLFRGSHALIRDGATLVDHPDQVLDTLGLHATPEVPRPVELSKIQGRIMEHLNTSLMSAEVIAAKAGLDAAEVLAELTMLELEGVVVREQGLYRSRL